MYEIQFYSTKKPFQRRQYRFRIVHENGNIIAVSSEGYNNKGDRNEAFWRMVKGLSMSEYLIKDRDK